MFVVRVDDILGLLLDASGDEGFLDGVDFYGDDVSRTLWGAFFKISESSKSSKTHSQPSFTKAQDHIAPEILFEINQKTVLQKFS